MSAILKTTKQGFVHWCGAAIVTEVGVYFKKLKLCQ